MRSIYLGCLLVILAFAVPSTIATRPVSIKQIKRISECIVQPDHAGYLQVEANASLFYAYYERQHCPAEDEGPAPIILWLQGGPGCASTFGLFYELGPHWVTKDLCLDNNPGAWNRRAALLIIDQPLGTGLSFADNTSAIPRDEMGMATHLYTALQHFFALHTELRERPLFITGESYGGKYVPSIAHYILQVQHSSQAVQQQAAGTAGAGLQHLRALPPHVHPPLFRLTGIAIGNGLTSPRAQTLTLSKTAWWAGLVDSATAAQLQQQAEEVVSLIDGQQWAEAHKLREDLRTNITRVAGLATMFDTRRTADYDPEHLVDQYLNNMDVRDALHASHKGNYTSCSDVVGDAMAADVMQSVAHLVPDILQHIPVLLYQGQFDVLDGPASNAVWIEAMEWPHREELVAQPSTLWECPGSCYPDLHPNELSVGWHPSNRTDNIGGWWRRAGRLTHAVVYRAGHMVPRDAPIAMRHLLETWIEEAMEYRR